MADQTILEGRLGGRLRALRRERGLSVRALAARSGFSPSFISNIESETVSPSIGSLEKIATVLGVTLSQLFSSLETEPRFVVRRQERTHYTSVWSRSTASALTDAAVHRKLAMVEVTVAPGGASGTQIMPSQDTILVVLRGTLAVLCEVETVSLSDGDTAYFEPDTSFSWRNESAEEVALLLVGGTAHVDLLNDLILQQPEPDVSP